MLKLLCLVPWHQASSREIFRFKLQNPDPEIQLAAMEVLLLVDYGVGACGRSIVRRQWGIFHQEPEQPCSIYIGDLKLPGTDMDRL